MSPPSYPYPRQQSEYITVSNRCLGLNPSSNHITWFTTILSETSSCPSSTMCPWLRPPNLRRHHVPRQPCVHGYDQLIIISKSGTQSLVKLHDSGLRPSYNINIR